MADRTHHHREPVVEAGIPLRPGETVAEFSRLLQSALESRVADAFMAGAEDRCSWYPEDVLATTVVIYVGRYVEPSFRAYFQVAWTRAEGGAFAFGDFTEVRRRVTYEPVDQPTVVFPVPMPPPQPAEEAQRLAQGPGAYAAPYTHATGLDEYLENGPRFTPGLSLFGHHRGNDPDPHDDGSVDIRELRRALASAGDWRRFGHHAAAVERRARAHLEAHADRIVAKAQRQAATETADQVNESTGPGGWRALAYDLHEIRAGRRGSVAERCRRDGLLVT